LISPHAQSGIDISDELLALYDQLKIKKAYKHISFTLAKTGTAAGKDVYGWTILEKSDPQPDDANEANFKAMVKSLPEGEPRFVVYDFTETKADGRLIKKRELQGGECLFFVWGCCSPECAGPTFAFCAAKATSPTLSLPTTLHLPHPPQLCSSSGALTL
jgi:hypothetical protein